MADIFYFFFMFIMANLMLWLFLAIFIDTYTEVGRHHRDGGRPRGPGKLDWGSGPAVVRVSVVSASLEV